MKIYCILFLAVLMSFTSSSILFAQVENSTEEGLICSFSTQNRLLSKLADADEVQGVDGAQKLSVQELLDASSTGATQQFAAEVEFRKKSNESDVPEDITPVVNRVPCPVLMGGPIGFTMEAACWLMNRTAIRSLTGLGRTVEATGSAARTRQAAPITTNSKIVALIGKKAINNRLIDVKKCSFTTIPSAGDIGNNTSSSLLENSSEYWEQVARSQAAGEAELASLWKQVAEEAEKATLLFQQSQDQYTKESQYDQGKSISLQNAADATLALAEAMATSIYWEAKENEAKDARRMNEARLWHQANQEIKSAIQKYQEFTKNHSTLTIFQMVREKADADAFMASVLSKGWEVRENEARSAGRIEEANLWQQVVQKAQRASQHYKDYQLKVFFYLMTIMDMEIQRMFVPNKLKNVADATLKSAKVMAKRLDWSDKERESMGNGNREEADLWKEAAKGAEEASLLYQQSADQYAVEKGDKGISLENTMLSDLECQANALFISAKETAIRAEKFSFESATNSSIASSETPKLMMEPQEVAEGLEKLRVASAKRVSRPGTARVGKEVENNNTIFVSSSSNNTTGFSIKPKNSFFEVSEIAKNFVTSVVDQVFHMPSTEASSRSMDVVQQESISHGIVSAKRAEFTMKEAMCYTVEQYRKSIVNIREEESYPYADELSREIAANEFEHRISLFIPKYIKRERSAFVRARSDWKPFSKAMKNFRKNPNKANFELADQARMESWKAVTNLAVVSAALADIYWTGYESFGETYYQTSMGYCCDMELDQLKRTMQEDARAIQDLALATFAAADATATSEADIADRGAVSRCSMAKFTDAMDSARWTNHYSGKIINDTWREEMQWVADAAQKVADFVSNDHYQIYNTPES